MHAKPGRHHSALKPAFPSPHAMPIVIDTYNVLHATGVLPPELSGIDLGGLIDLIRGSRYASEPILMVCDGTSGDDGVTGIGGAGGAGPRVQVRYAGPDRSADDVIAEIVAGSTAPRLLTVVSSDREVARNARRRRCPTLTAQAFLAHLAEDSTRPRTRPVHRPSGPLSENQIDRWIDQFELDECDLGMTSSRPEPPVRSAEGEPACESPSSPAAESPGRRPPASNSPFPADVLDEASDLAEEDQSPPAPLFD